MQISFFLLSSTSLSSHRLCVPGRSQGQADIFFCDNSPDDDSSWIVLSEAHFGKCLEFFSQLFENISFIYKLCVLNSQVLFHYFSTTLSLGV